MLCSSIGLGKSAIKGGFRVGIVVTCNANCYYNEKGLCSRRVVVGIDKNGMCTELWRNGQRRGPHDQGRRESPIIEEGKYKDVNGDDTKSEPDKNSGQS